MQDVAWDENDPVGYLWDVRSRANHLLHANDGSPGYGIVTTSREEIAEMYEAVDLLRMTVKYTLEGRSDTGSS